MNRLRALLREDTAGDPMGQRGLWTGKRLRDISSELAQLGLRVCPNTVRRLLDEIGYALHANRGMVVVGPSHDTPAFAVEAICQWWRRQGSRRYPAAPELLILADSGGSNGARCRA